MGRTLVLLCVVATCAEPPAGVVPQDTGTSQVPTDPTAFNSGDSCLESGCVAVGATYISHFTEANCQGTEHYFTRYSEVPQGVRASWNGTGVAGSTLRTVTNKSWRRWDGACFDDWPGGHQLTDMVRIYRGPLPVCDPKWFILSGYYAPETPGTYDYAIAHDFPSSAVCALPTAKTITWTRDGQVQNQCANNSWCSIYVTAGPSFTMGVTMVASNSVNSKTLTTSLAVTNNVKCPVSLSISGPSQPPGAGSYTYTANASAGECGGPFTYTWRQYYRFTTGAATPCGNVASCTIAYNPSDPFTLEVTAARTWRDGSTWTQTSALAVSSPFSVSISGPTSLANNEYATWNASVSGGLAPFGWQWYVDGQAVPDQLSMSRSFWGESWHTITVVAFDGVNNTAQHEITVYVAPGSDCTYLIGCEENPYSRQQNAKPTRPKPTVTQPWIRVPDSPFPRP